MPVFISQEYWPAFFFTKDSTKWRMLDPPFPVDNERTEWKVSYYCTICPVHKDQPHGLYVPMKWVDIDNEVETPELAKEFVDERMAIIRRRAEESIDYHANMPPEVVIGD